MGPFSAYVLVSESSIVTVLDHGLCLANHFKALQTLSLGT